MNAIVFEHVKVAELPEAWQSKLAKSADTHVTVRIEEEIEQPAVLEVVKDTKGDPAFGIWRDRADMGDVETYVKELRSRRYK